MPKSQNPPPYSTDQPQPTVVVGTTHTSTVIVGGAQYGPNNQHVTCPHCKSQILTQIRAESSRRTHTIAILLCVFFCWPCACVPYCMDSCKNKNHYCPSCGAYLGTYTN